MEKQQREKKVFQAFPPYKKSKNRILYCQQQQQQPRTNNNNNHSNSNNNNIPPLQPNPHELQHVAKSSADKWICFSPLLWIQILSVMASVAPKALIRK